MKINGSRILILGGWGLVGSAISRKLMQHSPSKLIITSLRKEEAEEAIDDLKREFAEFPSDMYEARWGNLFTRTDWKDIAPSDVINDKVKRLEAIQDIFSELDDTILHNSALYSLINEVKPDLVIDCINTATGIAYLDIYSTSNTVIKDLTNGIDDSANVEKLLASTYVPQLIRHVQILYKALQDVNATMYLKIGTSGTGGMGLNIPYTHSEDRPSRVLMSKTAVAGAHTMLMYLMARTPNGPLVKEIKPTATIAWKRIAYDTLKKGGKAIELVDMKFEDAVECKDSFNFENTGKVHKSGENFKSVFIDTGENGIFSKGEFEAISSLGQMEIVTPEEIAEYSVYEIIGGNTGRDIIQGIDAFGLGPTYRGGILREQALKKIEKLEKENQTESIAFELLGPPRLSKLLYEAYLLKRIAGSMTNLAGFTSKELSLQAEKLVSSDDKLRSQILSIGLPILLPNMKYLRGEIVKIPVKNKTNDLNFTEHNIEQWCYNGWIDLREQNFEVWKVRVEKIISQANSYPKDDTSSRFTYTLDYWNNFENFDGGKIAGWIFEFEDKGWRFKR